MELIVTCSMLLTLFPRAVVMASLARMFLPSNDDVTLLRKESASICTSASKRLSVKRPILCAICVNVASSAVASELLVAKMMVFTRGEVSATTSEVDLENFRNFRVGVCEKLKKKIIVGPKDEIDYAYTIKSSRERNLPRSLRKRRIPSQKNLEE